MSVLGAQTEELVSLATRLGATSGDISAVDAETQGVANAVIDQSEAAFSSAVSGITTAMDTMRGTVDAARAQLDGTTWTGANRAVFDGAYGDFSAAMVNLETVTNDAYLQFDAQMKQLNGFIREFQQQVSVSLSDAQASTTSMQTAVDAQRDNLETVMNTGLAIG